MGLLALTSLWLGCAGPRVEVRRFNPAGLSTPTGYAHVVEARGGRTLYVSGQISVDRDGHVVGAGDFAAQTRQVFENLKAALAAGGASLRDVVKLTVFVTDISQVPVFRQVRDEYLREGVPASSLVEVSRLVRPELLLEIDAVAVAE